MGKEKRFRGDMDEIRERDEDVLDLLRPRLLGAGVVVLLFAIIIFGRLWVLQISHGDDYRRRAYDNRVRPLEITPPRGHIVDRNGIDLVTNRPSFDVMLVRENSKNDDELLKRLAYVLDVDVSRLVTRLREASNVPNHVPICLKEDISWEKLAYLENHNHDFPGIRIQVTPRRVYPFGDLASHLIGYLGTISKKELSRAQEGEYDGDDQVGKSGMEKLREKDLRGEKGESLAEVNSLGFVQQVLKREEPLPGREVRLTIDSGLQQVAERQFLDSEDNAGAVVVLEVKTGRVLTLASAPQIHLDDWVGGISVKNWKKYNEDTLKTPLLNKAVQGLYPPGSTYKMITAFAGLQEGAITKDSTFYCPGHLHFGNRNYSCWLHSGHGNVTVIDALEQSCDVFFYQTGLLVGVDGIAEYAHMFGLGEKTGLEIESEQSGLIPTRKWKFERYEKKWQEGETLSIAIGQGYDSVTPLQIANMTAMIANDGKRYQPQIVERVTDSDGTVREQFSPKLVYELKGAQEQFRIIKQGMFNVVQGRKGTARNSVRIEGLHVAGKTGSAQVVKLKQYKHLKEEDIPYKYRDHAWFTCYAPAEDPQIAVTVIVEHGLHGGSAAGPIARKILEYYFGISGPAEAGADEGH